MGKRKGGYSSLVAKTEENRPLGRTMHKYTKIMLKTIRHLLKSSLSKQHGIVEPLRMKTSGKSFIATVRLRHVGTLYHFINL